MAFYCGKNKRIFNAIVHLEHTVHDTFAGWIKKDGNTERVSREALICATTGILEAHAMAMLVSDSDWPVDDAQKIDIQQRLNSLVKDLSKIVEDMKNETEEAE